MKILVVDDEYIIQMGLKRCLEKIADIRCEVTTASGAAQALEHMQSSRPDLLITDISMPQVSGLELIEIAQKEKLCSNFVVLSGYSDFENTHRALRCGVCDYLLKPVNQDELRRVILEVAGQSGRQEDLSLLKPYEALFANIKAPGEVPYPLMKIVQYIHGNYRSNISLRALAELSGKSENYICGQFKKELNINYMDMINELRLREALSLLLYQPMLSVREISEKVGYGTERQLFRLIKSRLNMTPQQVRKSEVQ